MERSWSNRNNSLVMVAAGSGSGHDAPAAATAATDGWPENPMQDFSWPSNWNSYTVAAAEEQPQQPQQPQDPDWHRYSWPTARDPNNTNGGTPLVVPMVNKSHNSPRRSQSTGRMDADGWPTAVLIKYPTTRFPAQPPPEPPQQQQQPSLQAYPPQEITQEQHTPILERSASRNDMEKEDPRNSSSNHKHYAWSSCAPNLRRQLRLPQRLMRICHANKSSSSSGNNNNNPNHNHKNKPSDGTHNNSKGKLARSLSAEFASPQRRGFSMMAEEEQSTIESSVISSNWDDAAYCCTQQNSSPPNRSRSCFASLVGDHIGHKPTPTSPSSSTPHPPSTPQHGARNGDVQQQQYGTSPSRNPMPLAPPTPDRPHDLPGVALREMENEWLTQGGWSASGQGPPPRQPERNPGAVFLQVGVHPSMKGAHSHQAAARRRASSTTTGPRLLIPGEVSSSSASSSSPMMMMMHHHKDKEMQRKELEDEAQLFTKLFSSATCLRELEAKGDGKASSPTTTTASNQTTTGGSDDNNNGNDKNNERAATLVEDTETNQIATTNNDNKDNTNTPTSAIVESPTTRNPYMGGARGNTASTKPIPPLKRRPPATRITAKQLRMIRAGSSDRKSQEGGSSTNQQQGTKSKESFHLGEVDETAAGDDAPLTGMQGKDGEHHHQHHHDRPSVIRIPDDGGYEGDCEPLRRKRRQKSRHHQDQDPEQLRAVVSSSRSVTSAREPAVNVVGEKTREMLLTAIPQPRRMAHGQDADDNSTLSSLSSVSKSHYEKTTTSPDTSHRRGDGQKEAPSSPETKSSSSKNPIDANKITDVDADKMTAFSYAKNAYYFNKVNRFRVVPTGMVVAVDEEDDDEEEDGYNYQTTNLEPIVVGHSRHQASVSVSTISHSTHDFSMPTISRVDDDVASRALREGEQEA